MIGGIGMKTNYKIILRNIDGKSYEVDEIFITPANKIEFTLSSGKRHKFNPDKHKFFSGGKELSPLYSYSINHWNVTLPWVTYKEDEEKVRDYLKAIGILMYDE